jgi:phenylalanyl-tRNA synthetase alpha chain
MNTSPETNPDTTAGENAGKSAGHNASHGTSSGTGHIHPISQVTQELYRIFAKMGFEVAEGPEIETEFYNFDALGVAKDHSSRDMQDTFWLKETSPDGQKLLPRTHTSSVQVRFAQKNKPPFKIIAPGKVFRNETTDATHEAEFYQIEGMMVAKKVTMVDLKETLKTFALEFFGPDSDIRFRPSYFPFVEPGIEVDVKFKGKWLEVLGAGLTHPEVLKASGLDPEEWQGFAFGMGLDRLVMLKYGIPDIRHLYSADLRVINQF